MNTKVYVASIDNLSYERLYAAADDRRRTKADAMRFLEDKRRCLAAGALLRYALSQLGIGDYQVETEERGKPYLKGLPVHFSLSHSGSFVLCALSDAPVGCDIQQIQQANGQLARRYFAPGEIALLENLPPEQAREQFCRLWVLKESLGKALGCGLNESILGREFDFSAAAPALQSEPKLFFREYSLPGYRCAVCSQTADASDLISVTL
jgi:4'-phosphopantetheinyl transferase